MGYRLAPTFSFCRCEGRFFFLDLEGDRYFCLAPAIESAFGRLIAGRAPAKPDVPLLDRLILRGILIPTSDPVRPAPCDTGLPTYQIRPDALQSTRRRDMASAVAELMRARYNLRHRRLIRILADLERRKAALEYPASPQREALETLAHGFARALRMTGSLNQCLALSIAMTRKALASNLRVDLVMGVRARPFQAHAWVQAGSFLVSDTLDRVGMFTPIFTL
ncbi:hypothetical protein GCM10023219_20580 [Stakelama sediminis]|uniref:Microcin J25-processing protein McjB C-terminal domain-containing protein n=1 Tax=Stakelama sediminis TaxID=463200 RepID=A0A840Z1Y3_9SPHN|nr:lasso peptide biosynthesis B2 protein [Stakelama sediminis]MBB5719925.1 hypothetical protein [Stakelama sediminis]